MTETAFPFEAGAGAISTELQWGKMARRWLSDGIIPNYLSPSLAVQQRGAGANMSVDVGQGAAFLQGHYYENDGTLNKTIGANSSGSTRIDRVVLRLDRAANTLTCEILEGTPGAGAPALTQTSSGVYELPLARVTVASGASSIVTANLTEERAVAPTEPHQVGDLKPTLATSPEPGWKLCDGSAVSRITYADLFALRGTADGAGDGSTTFNLPNGQGRFLVGYKSGDADFGTLGGTGGAKSETTSAPSSTFVADTVGAIQNTASEIHTHDVDVLPPYLVVNWMIYTGMV